MFLVNPGVYYKAPVIILVEEGSFIYVNAEENTEKDCPELSGDRPAIVIDSLMDIARPAKVRGLAREYEIIPCPPRVIALEEESDDSCFPIPAVALAKEGGDEEWEKVGESSESEANGRNTDRKHAWNQR